MLSVLLLAWVLRLGLIVSVNVLSHTINAGKYGKFKTM